MPVCNPLHVAVLGEGHEAALKLGWISSRLINKIQLSFPSYNVLCQHLAFKWHAATCLKNMLLMLLGRPLLGRLLLGRLLLGQAVIQQAANNSNECH